MVVSSTLFIFTPILRKWSNLTSIFFPMGGLIMYQLVKHLHGSPEDEARSNEESCWRCAAQKHHHIISTILFKFHLAKWVALERPKCRGYQLEYIYIYNYTYIYIGTYLATAVVFEAKKNGDIPNHLAPRSSGHFHAISKVKVLFSYLKQIFIGNFFRPKWWWNVREILPKIKIAFKWWIWLV